MHRGIERRKHKRIQKPFVVRFQVKSQEAGKKVLDWDVGAMLNLGAGGALFYCNKKLKIDSFLNLKIDFPAYKKPINCVGKVIRAERLHHAHVFLVATVFTNIGAKEKEILNKIAEEHHSRKE